MKKKIRLLLSGLLMTTLFAATVSPAYVYADDMPDISLPESGIELETEIGPEIIDDDFSEISDFSGAEEEIVYEDADNPDASSGEYVKGRSDPARVVVSVKKVPASDRIIFAGKKGTIEEAVAQLPKTWQVTFKDGSKKKVRVFWTCMDNFDDSRYSSFVFQGKTDDKSVSEVTDKNADRKLRMEIVFHDFDKYDGNINESKGSKAFRLSPNNLFGESEKEQEALNAGDDTFGGNKLKISKSAYNTFRKLAGRNKSYVYKHLSKEEKKFYNRVDDLVNQYLYYGKKPIKYNGAATMAGVSWGNLTWEQQYYVLGLYQFDNPQAFFLCFSHYPDEAAKKSYMCFFPGSATPSAIKQQANRIAANLNSAVKTVNKQKGEYKKAKKAQEHICWRLAFDVNSDQRTGNGTEEQLNNMVDGNYYYECSLICTFYKKQNYTSHLGYAISYTALARLAGLDAVTVPTNANRRFYNKVRVKGKWYNLAPVAESQNPEGLGCSYKYFLKSDAKIKKLNPTFTLSSYWKNLYPKCSKNYK